MILEKCSQIFQIFEILIRISQWIETYMRFESI